MSDGRAIKIILATLTAFGLISCLLASLNLDLDSDTVVPGLVTMEIIQHGNFGFSYPVDDPYLFTDIFTFHFLPQVLSGYDPTVLRLTAFAMFTMVVVVFSYLIYRYSNLTSALLFSALFTNLQPGAFALFLSPEYHVGSLLFAGIFFVLFQTEIIRKLPFYAVAALAVAVGLIVISDSIILAFFVVPYLGYCLYAFWIRKNPEEGSKKDKAAQAANRKRDVSKIMSVLALLGAASVVAYVLKIKNFFLNLHLFFVTTKTMGPEGIDTHFSRFVESLVQLVSHNFLNIVNGGINVFDAAISAVLIFAIAYSVIWRNAKAGYLYWMFLLSSLVMFVAFVFTTLGDGGTGRFLLLIAVAVFGVIALAYKPEAPGWNLNTVLLAAAIVLILATIAANIVTIAGYDYQPNKEDYALISYLKDNNLTYGYSDYNSGNKLIYLSKQEVLYPKVSIVNNGFYAVGMLMTPRWYGEVNKQDKLCILVRENDSLYGDAQKIIELHPPINTYHYGDYTIYQFDMKA